MAPPAYTPDNTRSSIIVIGFIAAAVALIAVLIGLSEKPEINSIGVVAERVPASAEAFTLDDDTADADEAGLAEGAFSAAEDTETATDQGDSSDSSATDGGQSALDGDEAVTATTPIPIPTLTPEPTAEIAAAVEPVPDAAATDADGQASAAAPSTIITPGTIVGSFFTRPDEDEGATVQRNELTLTINEDGTGSFSGALDLTMPDATQITLSMSGPIRWTTAQPPTPQVEATVTGSYSYDSQIDLDDVMAADAELTISSLGSGSGSLCFPRCFGFTFPPQTGF